MAQQAQIVIAGNVCREPQRFGQEGGTPCCIFRLAASRRFWNRSTQTWQDSPTTWVSVKTFWSLALNVMRSLKKGDAVVVSGVLSTNEWDRGGQLQSGLSIEATSVGHDLNRGISVFTRVPNKANNGLMANGAMTNEMRSESSEGSESEEFSGFEGKPPETGPSQPAQTAPAMEREAVL